MSAYQAANQPETIFTRPALKGLISTLLFMGSPLLAYIGWVFGTESSSSFLNVNNDYKGYYILGVTSIIAIWWASNIVQCVWEMIRYNSKSASTGLWLSLLAPFIWAWIIFLTGVNLLAMSGVPFLT